MGTNEHKNMEANMKQTPTQTKETDKQFEDKIMVNLKKEYKQAKIENELYKVGFEQGKSSAIKEEIEFLKYLKEECIKLLEKGNTESKHKTNLQ